MIVNVAYTLLFNTGLFPDAFRAWQSRAISGKTWEQFTLDFATAHRDIRLTNQTAHQSGFHSANMMIEQGSHETMQDTVDVIAQLTTATASDRGTVATLTTTNAKLTTQLETAHAQTAQLKNEIATLKNKIKPAWQGQREIAYMRDMQHEEERTLGCSEQEQPHGRSPMGQGMMRRGS
jgi:hypothetical protein